MANRTAIQELQKALGDKYSIQTIDFEKCLYRDFVNGFNVEISGCNRPRPNKTATIYLWFGDKAPVCLIVKTVHNIGLTADSIRDAVDELYDISKLLIANGYNNRSKLFDLKNHIDINYNKIK